MDTKVIYEKLLMCSVFTEVLTDDIFTSFFKYCKETDRDKKIRAYAEMVSAVYKEGSSLTDAVLRLVFEDDNIYIRNRARKAKNSSQVIEAVKRELEVFSEFSALSPTDFERELSVEYVSPFSSREVDFLKEYASRIDNISKYGYGIFTSHPMFALSESGLLTPVLSADRSRFSDFVGYEAERREVVENTKALLGGKPALNALLIGEAGTGKSSTVKAIVNEFFDKGLRLIELKKNELSRLPYVMGKIAGNPLKFIIFVDDLSFSQNDDNFGMLKAALEGSASAKAENAVIYATSNRRHIVKESFSDRTGDDVHRADTLAETLSLSERFGLVVRFGKPDKGLYLEIARELAAREGIETDEEFDIKAEAAALKKGNRSPRCAEQFVKSLLNK